VPELQSTDIGPLFFRGVVDSFDFSQRVYFVFLHGLAKIGPAVYRPGLADLSTAHNYAVGFYRRFGH
jgi:hypothetical protein